MSPTAQPVPVDAAELVGAATGAFVGATLDTISQYFHFASHVASFVKHHGPPESPSGLPHCGTPFLPQYVIPEPVRLHGSRHVHPSLGWYAE